MDELHLIDLTEKARAYALAECPGLGPRLDGLRAAEGKWREQPDAFFKGKLVAVALGLDDESPAGRRALRRELQRAEMAAFFPAGELEAALRAMERAPSVAEEGSEGYGAATARRRARLARSLASFRATGGEGGDGGEGGGAVRGSFARRLGGHPSAMAAAAWVASEMPALSGGYRAFEFLVECGYPAAVPWPEAIRMTQRIGLVGTFAQAGARGAGRGAITAAARRAYLELVERMARLTGAAVSEVGLALGQFSRGGERVEAICAARPRCEACAASAYCDYARLRLVEPPSPPPRPAIKHWAKSERPRERMMSGERLTDSELLAIMLRTGAGGGRSAVDLARELLARFGNSLHRVAAASPGELVAAGVKGIGPAKAVEISAALELGRRAAIPEADAREGLRAVSTSREVFDLLRPRWKAATQEEFMLLALNSKNRVTREVVISRGTLNASIVHPRDVFSSALREAASGVIFAHNHPSGDPTPSQEDMALTRQLAQAGKLLGIRVLDHVIVGATRYYSFADEGALS